MRRTEPSAALIPRSRQQKLVYVPAARTDIRWRINAVGYSQAKLNAVARQLNERPRKTLGFHTPAEMFS
jgi:hypothetical protein